MAVVVAVVPSDANGDPLTDVDGSPLFYDPGSAGVTTGLCTVTPLPPN